MLSKPLIQFSVDGQGCVPSLLFDLRPNYGEGNEDTGDLLQNVPCMHCHIQCPRPCSRPPTTHAFAKVSWTLTGKSASVSCGAIAPFSWVLVCTRIDAFELWCWRRLFRVPWTAKRYNQSILKEISLEYSLEGWMLKLKLQYFGHLMQRIYSFEKTLMLGKIEGGRRRGYQRMSCLDGITNLMDMSLSKLQ